MRSYILRVEEDAKSDHSFTCGECGRQVITAHGAARGNPRDMYRELLEHECLPDAGDQPEGAFVSGIGSATYCGLCGARYDFLAHEGVKSMSLASAIERWGRHLLWCTKNDRDRAPRIDV